MDAVSAVKCGKADLGERFARRASVSPFLGQALAC